MPYSVDQGWTKNYQSNKTGNSNAGTKYDTGINTGNLSKNYTGNTPTSQQAKSNVNSGSVWVNNGSGSSGSGSSSAASTLAAHQAAVDAANKATSERAAANALAKAKADAAAKAAQNAKQAQLSDEMRKAAERSAQNATAAQKTKVAEAQKAKEAAATAKKAYTVRDRVSSVDRQNDDNDTLYGTGGLLVSSPVTAQVIGSLVKSGASNFNPTDFWSNSVKPTVDTLTPKFTIPEATASNATISEASGTSQKTPSIIDRIVDYANNGWKNTPYGQSVLALANRGQPQIAANINAVPSSSPAYNPNVTSTGQALTNALKNTSNDSFNPTDFWGNNGTTNATTNDVTDFWKGASYAPETVEVPKITIPSQPMVNAQNLLGNPNTSVASQLAGMTPGWNNTTTTSKQAGMTPGWNELTTTAKQAGKTPGWGETVVTDKPFGNYDTGIDTANLNNNYSGLTPASLAAQQNVMKGEVTDEMIANARNNWSKNSGNPTFPTDGTSDEWSTGPEDTSDNTITRDDLVKLIKELMPGQSDDYYANAKSDAETYLQKALGTLKEQGTNFSNRLNDSFANSILNQQISNMKNNMSGFTSGEGIGAILANNILGNQSMANTMNETAKEYWTQLMSDVNSLAQKEADIPQNSLSALNNYYTALSTALSEYLSGYNYGTVASKVNAASQDATNKSDQTIAKWQLASKT